MQNNQLRIGGEATAIVNTLLEYGRDRPVPTGLVARAIGRDEADIRDTLKALESKGVVNLEDEGSTIRLNKD